MPGAGRSHSAVVRGVGAALALIAAVGYLTLDWSFGGSGSATATGIGVAVAVFAVGWTLYGVYSRTED